MSFLNLISNCFSRKNHRENDNMETSKEIFYKKIQNRLSTEGTKFNFPLNPGDDSKRNSLSDLTSKIVGARKGYSTDESSTNDDIETFSEVGDSPVFSKEDWLRIIKNGNVESMSFSELANSLRHGIPAELRPMIWEYLTDIESLKKQYPPSYYSDLKSKKSPSDKYIEKDVPRTYPDHPFFMENQNQSHLTNILRAYANHDKQVGYTQGMNFIAGMLLIILDPNNYKDSELSYFENYREEFEEKAFWIFIYILCVKNFRITYKSELPKFHGMIKALDSKIKAKAPDVYMLIKTNELQIAQCFQEKLLSMLFSHTPVPLASVILDMFFVDEERVLFKVIIRSILICKKEILELHDSMELLTFFNKGLMETCYEKCKDRMYLLFPAPEYAD